MNKHKKTGAMVESALITAIAVIFALAGMYMPFLNVLLIFLPVPFIIIGVRNGLKYNILSLIVAAIMISSLTHPIRAILFFISTVLISIVIVYMIQKKYSFNLTIFFGSIAAIISVMISFALMPKVFGVTPVEMIENSFVQAMEIYKGIFEMAGTDPEKVSKLMDTLEKIKSLSLLVIPTSVIMSAVSTTYINYIVSGMILKRIGIFIERPKKFSYFNLPKNFMMGALLIVVLTYLANTFNIVNSETLNTNIMMLFQIIFIIQGLSVVSFWIEKRGIGNVLRTMILIFLLFISRANLILFFLGLLDVMINIRNLEN